MYTCIIVHVAHAHVYEYLCIIYTYVSALPTWDTCPCGFCQVSHSIKVDNSNREVHLMTAQTAQEGEE